MDSAQVTKLLDDAGQSARWFGEIGIEDAARGHKNLVAIVQGGVTLDLMSVVCNQLHQQLPRLSDADMALNNLERFFGNARNPLGLASLFERDSDALPVLLQIFSTSQHLSDLLIRDAEAFDLLRLTAGRPIARQTLVDEINSEIDQQTDSSGVSTTLRRYKHRETLRIAYGDHILGQSLETVTRQISYLADAILEGGLRYVRRELEAKRGVPRTPGGSETQFVVLGLGKLGGEELNYSSDIDLICLYEADGQTDSRRPMVASEFFDRLVRDLVKLLTEASGLGSIYRVDLRLRPEGSRGPLAISLDSARHYYDTKGRTWERQAFIKARPVAGHLHLGYDFLAALEPWIYRRYLQRADIAGIKALKRRIEQRTRREGAEEHDVKTGHGGIRDIEFVIQFLQLLNGGDLPKLRTAGTLEAIANLEEVGCLTHQESAILEKNYTFLRQVEHRLQIMFDLQTHAMHGEPAEQQKLAIRMGYSDADAETAGAAFEKDFRQRTDENRRILDHILHDAFEDDAETDPEVDLVLDPDPSVEEIREALGRYPFEDVEHAYEHLMQLGNEKIRFLSTRRCRMFLASIAPRLLAAISERPDPDSTLVNLSKVSDSLGGKGVLWELFSFNPPSLRMYVEMCASSPYLCDILTSNPGMIDELMDSLVLDKLPDLATMEATLDDLCRAAEDIDPILHSFKNAQFLRVGIRDILGKEDVLSTTGALSDLAEACLRQVARLEYQKLIRRLGEPIIAGGPQAGHVCQMVVLGMGKFGGRELNYHSDLDIVFLYEADGTTQHRHTGRPSRDTTSNQHFFGELGQRIIKVVSQLGPYGRLYEIDPRLRPTGKSGSLATSFAEFARYFADGDGQLWERAALCRARPVVANDVAAARAIELVGTAAFDHPWSADDVANLARMRSRLEDAAGKGNLKRGSGGIVDIEFITQMLQLREGGAHPKVREPNTLCALTTLHEQHCLSRKEFQFLSTSYRLLRRIESRLRLMNSTARDDLPKDPDELGKLARMVGYSDAEALLAACRVTTNKNREMFERFFTRAGAARSANA